VARVLIVGCGCRGRALARELIASGHVVRGTTREPMRLRGIEASGVQAVVADPDRLGTIMAQLAEVSVVCWLLGSVDAGAAAELHGPRLRTLLERLVDTPVRGLVYEGAGQAAPDVLASGARAVREASRTWRLPVAVTETEPSDHPAWLAEMRAAVSSALSAEPGLSR
jgi:nucleoside-diphosphate-sugar epimerase